MSQQIFAIDRTCATEAVGLTTAVMSVVQGMGGHSWKNPAGFIASLGPCASTTFVSTRPHCLHCREQ